MKFLVFLILSLSQTGLAADCPDLSRNLGSYGTAEHFVSFFNNVWQSGDPTQFNAGIFTPNVELVDPSAHIVGAQAAEKSFAKLFRYFPTLRGRVRNFSSNESEIFIDWEFIVGKYRVPAVDKFCLVGGKISYREAFFDSVTLTKAIVKTYGPIKVLRFLADKK